MAEALITPNYKRRKISEDKEICILCSESINNTEYKELKTNVPWNKLKERALMWKDSGFFPSVYDTVIWETGHVGKSMHLACKIRFQSARFLNEQKISRSKHQTDKKCP